MELPRGLVKYSRCRKHRASATRLTTRKRSVLIAQFKGHCSGETRLAILSAGGDNTAEFKLLIELEVNENMNAKDSIKMVDASKAGKIDIDKKCSKCKKSICCNSINQKIPAPKTKEDFDHLIWQVSHENISVFKDSDGWFLYIATRCSHLLDGGVCNIYDNRPWVCREYTNDFCEYDESIEEASEFWF